MKVSRLENLPECIAKPVKGGYLLKGITAIKTLPCASAGDKGVKGRSVTNYLFMYCHALFE